MKGALTLFIGLLFFFSLTGCIAEDYDFTPPTVTLSNTDSVQSVDLEEVNIDWRGENGEQIEKHTENILAFARERKQLNFSSGQQVDLLFDSEDFVVEELSVSVWKNDEKVKLNLNDYRSFYFPKDKGVYVIDVELRTDRGSAQYVGNVVIK
ncbi:MULTISPECIES: hypothetical protein [unclassified Bacillus (in: firmicutes)]|uniref:hypothetical protein n=1 Tax=unclassified Bacillus (in: firmicutes) TaxID=185979 RepID=UPI0008E88A43|nr:MULTISPECIES: hypothetical protein [unclassified Bacillus (in: firmicutes)]SFA85271.1 hypothetical protein SAMN02799634_10212 [Bacillus sp. UNCCL13]SFQ83332.1 hypothetical protein SAMN04488577_2132 [Bacillus sp. cl95]